MGIHPSIRRIAGDAITRGIFVLILIFSGLISPWWITLLIGGVLAISGALSIEIVIIGIILDLILGSGQMEIEGIFFTLSFFLITIISIVLKQILNRPSI